MDDIEIIDLYWRREPTAIEETQNKYGTWCRKIAYDILRSNQDTEECVNDTYLTAWNTIPPVRPTIWARGWPRSPEICASTG